MVMFYRQEKEDVPDELHGVNAKPYLKTGDRTRGLADLQTLRQLIASDRDISY